jgi:hypothetical protein
MKYNYKKICLSLIITVCAALTLNFAPKVALAKEQIKNPSKTFQFSVPGREKFFITKNIGWKAEYDALGMFKEEMTLYKTIEGGKSWTLMADTNKLKTIPVSGDKTGMSFISSKKGWITANAPWEGKIGLLTTDNGGITWYNQKLSIPIKFKHTEINSYPPLILSTNDALLVTFAYLNDNLQHPLIYITHNAGGTWLPSADKTSGSSNEIKWKVINSAQRTLRVDYQSSAWAFEGEKWTKIK